MPAPGWAQQTTSDMDNHQAKLNVRGRGGNNQENPPGPQITSVEGRNKWTRPQPAPFSSRPSGRGRGRGSGGASHFTKGREGFSFLRGAHAETYLRPTVTNGKGNKWVSSSRDTSRNAVVTDGSNDSNSSGTATAEMKSATLVAPVGDATTAIDKRTSNFEKRGTHKLVMKRKTDLSENTSADFKVDGSKAAINAALSSKPPTPEFSRNSLGGNNIVESSLTQLIDTQSLRTEIGGKHSAKAVPSAEAKQASSSRRQRSNDFSGKSRSWTRKSSDDTTTDSMEIKTKQAEGLSARGEVDFAGKNYDSSHQRKRKHPSSSAGPRRINLLKTATASSINEASKNVSGDKNEHRVDAKNKSMIETKESSSSADRHTTTSQKTLTDFCYQDTGGGRDRGRGLPSVRGGGSTGGRNMGLVRVKPPNEEAICATFLRGLQCNNPKCTLRHDVATEASRPICVFFQRNGMCNKGDECPFRHVKVRWDAEKSRIL